MNEKQPGEFTHSEIISQPEAWFSTVRGLSKITGSQLPRLEEYDHIIFTGCGSTYYLSQWAGGLLRENGFLNTESFPASEIWLQPDIYLPAEEKTLLVAISRSGKTSETINAVDVFKNKINGDLLAVTCYPDSDLAGMADFSILMPAGQERSVAQTRSFTCMMIGILHWITQQDNLELGEKLGNACKDIFEKYKSLPDLIAKDDRLNKFFFLGSGRLYGLACEIMLKMKEMSISYSEAYRFMEFRHGPMAMVDHHSLIVGLQSTDLYQYESRIIDEMRDLGASTLTLGINGQPEFDIDLASTLPALWSDVLYLPILQLIAYERAINNGLDPDLPINLSAVVQI